MDKRFLRVKIPKRQRKDDETNSDEPTPKSSRTMLALAAQEVKDQDISTPQMYVKAVGDPVWKKM